MTKTPRIVAEKAGWLPRLLGWFVSLSKSNAMLWLLAIASLIVFLLNFTFSGKGHFSMESLPGFYGLFGAAYIVVITLLAKLWRSIVTRDDTYYGSKAVDSEEAEIANVEGGKPHVD